MVEIEKNHAALGAGGDGIIDDLRKVPMEIAIVVQLRELVPFGDFLSALGVNGVDNRQRDGLRKDSQEGEIGFRVSLATRGDSAPALQSSGPAETSAQGEEPTA
jgi:hypothetical protein